MTIWQRWKQTSLPNKLLVSAGILMAFGTLFYGGVAIFQYRMMRDQSETTKGQLRAMQEQSNVMQRSLDTFRDQANTMKAQTNTLNESLTETRKSVNAAEKQANSSQASVKAAERGVQIAQETFRLAERPSFGMESYELPKVGEEVLVPVLFRNSGHMPASNATVSSAIIFERAKDVSAPCSEPKIAGFVGLRSQSSIPINGTKTVRAHSFDKLTPPDIEAIKTGVFWFYVYIIVRYEGAGKIYVTEYYSRYSFTSGLLDECANHNRAT